MIKPIGLTGGIATGKSSVAEMFRILGAVTVSGDKIAARILRINSDLLAELATEFGQEILTEDGHLNREKMLSILLEIPGAMKRQLKILSPYILPAIDQIAEKFIAEANNVPVIVEAPLLFEYGHPERYFPIIVVAISRNLQIERLMKRSGKSVNWAKKVIDLQISMDKKISKGHYIIRNDKSPDETRKQVEHLYQILKKKITNH